jgi:non-specific serine/threonine protein kinase/serine/threonine-protein kinase
MDTGQWQQVKTAFGRALDLLPEERADYVESLSDPAVRLEVASLLASHRQADDLMEIPAIRLDADSPDDPERDPWIGKDIGGYHVISRIGRGGMGVVYQAVRVGDHFLKLVALKVVRSGVGSEDSIRRFKNERQILASLEHANIARLLDGGATEDGLPYLIMEYIEGKPVDEYCDARRLTIPERLKLFQDICAAVQYAHQNLIVHRDIKPANILVTADAVPKLLDFGIAKLLEPQLYFQTADPTVALRPMTPEYASPEQIRGDSITTSSDIYSLGVVLYRLLTGHPPYRVHKTPPHELAKSILETEPERPSTALKREEEIKDAEGQPVQVTPESAATARSEHPENLRRRLSGDLDNIVMKALRKDPARRYVSVAQFSEDIGRHLDGLPVIARKDTLGYRASKFVRRHRIGVAAIAAIFFLLVAGMIATTWQARVAGEQRAIANRRFNDVRKLANSLLFELHDSIKDLPGSTPARKLLVTRALEYLDSLSQEAKGDASLQRELAVAYLKIGDVQGQPRQASLGDRAGAEASYRKGLAIREALVAADPRNVDLRRELVTAYGKLSDLLHEKGNSAGAMEMSDKQRASVDEILAADPKNVSSRILHAMFRMDHGYKQATIGNDREGGLADLRQGSRLLAELAAERPQDQSVHRILGLSYSRTAEILKDTRSARPEALDLYKKALAVTQGLVRADPNNADYQRIVAYDQFEMGSLLKDMGELSQAAMWDRQALASFEKLAAADPASPIYRQDIAAVSRDLGEVLTRTGNAESAIEHFQRSLSILQLVPAADDPHSIVGAAALADQFWLGKAHVLASISPTASANGKLEHCREALKWFRKCLPALEGLRRSGSDDSAAKQIQEIQRDLKSCPEQ